jgi:RimJ/RimL family protein N-acetyltransferase
VRRLSDQQLIGSTRYYDIEMKHRHLSIGNTWYIQAVWGSAVNSECKYLLLQQAFENLKMLRVQFKTDARNIRSRKALEKIGATEEGVLRQHLILDNGVIRDSVVYSIIHPEWPRVKSDLERKRG